MYVLLYLVVCCVVVLLLICRIFFLSAQAFVELAENATRGNRFFVLSAWMGSEIYGFLNRLSLEPGFVNRCFVFLEDFD